MSADGMGNVNPQKFAGSSAADALHPFDGPAAGPQGPQQPVWPGSQYAADVGRRGYAYLNEHARREGMSLPDLTGKAFTMVAVGTAGVAAAKAARGLGFSPGASAIAGGVAALGSAVAFRARRDPDWTPDPLLFPTRSSRRNAARFILGGTGVVIAGKYLVEWFGSPLGGSRS